MLPKWNVRARYYTWFRGDLRILQKICSLFVRQSISSWNDSDFGYKLRLWGRCQVFKAYIEGILQAKKYFKTSRQRINTLLTRFIVSIEDFPTSQGWFSFPFYVYGDFSQTTDKKAVCSFDTYLIFVFDLQYSYRSLIKCIYNSEFAEPWEEGRGRIPANDWKILKK